MVDRAVDLQAEDRTLETAIVSISAAFEPERMQAYERMEKIGNRSQTVTGSGVGMVSR